MERKAPKTISSETALEILNEAGAVGPLGKLNDVSAGWPRDEIPGDDSDVDENEVDLLRAIVSRVSGSEGAQGLVSIWKKDEKTARMVYVGETDPADFLADGPHSFLAENFGAGEYELKVYTSERKMFKRPRVTISKMAADFMNRKKGVVATIPLMASGSNSDLAELGKIMVNGFAQLGALIVKAQPPAQSRMELLAELGQMKAIFGGGGGNGSDPVEMFTRLAGIFKNMQPRESAGGMGDFLELADRFTPIISEAIKAAKSPDLPALPGQPGPSPAQLSQPAVARPGPALTPEQEGAKTMSLQLKMQLGYLCAEAARDSDPGPYAAIINDKVPREVLNALLADENWLDALAKFHPRVKEFPVWFGELRELIIEEQAEENLPSSENGATNLENLTENEAPNS